MSNLLKRIGENTLNTTYVDGQVFYHTDLNQIISVFIAGINANFEDIQRIQNGDIDAGNALLLDGLEVSRLLDEFLQDNDALIPTSAQVKAYVDNNITTVNNRIGLAEGEITNKVDKVIELWKTPTLANGWTTGTPGVAYRKDDLGNVYLRGKVLTGGNVGQPVFILGNDYCPGVDYTGIVIDALGETKLLTIDTDGKVIIGDTPNTFASFDLVMFSID